VLPTVEQPAAAALTLGGLVLAGVSHSTDQITPGGTPGVSVAHHSTYRSTTSGGRVMIGE
jgi:hypothetical protein